MLFWGAIGARLLMLVMVGAALSFSLLTGFSEKGSPYIEDDE